MELKQGEIYQFRQNREEYAMCIIDLGEMDALGTHDIMETLSSRSIIDPNLLFWDSNFLISFIRSISAVIGVLVSWIVASNHRQMVISQVLLVN